MAEYIRAGEGSKDVEIDFQVGDDTLKAGEGNVANLNAGTRYKLGNHSTGCKIKISKGSKIMDLGKNNLVNTGRQPNVSGATPPPEEISVHRPVQETSDEDTSPKISLH